MNKRKYIVKFQAHDENELVCAINVEHAKIIAQHKRIQMGEVDISVKSVEEIKPYVVKIDKYEITRLDNELTITIGNEYFNTDDDAEIIIFELVKRIEELETVADKKNKGLENLLYEMKKDIHDLASSDTITRLRELIGLKR